MCTYPLKFRPLGCHCIQIPGMTGFWGIRQLLLLICMATAGASSESLYGMVAKKRGNSFGLWGTFETPKRFFFSGLSNLIKIVPGLPGPFYTSWKSWKPRLKWWQKTRGIFSEAMKGSWKAPRRSLGGLKSLVVLLLRQIRQCITWKSTRFNSCFTCIASKLYFSEVLEIPESFYMRNIFLL